MLEQLDLSDDERDALEGRQAALSALVATLADGPRQLHQLNANSDPQARSFH